MNNVEWNLPKLEKDEEFMFLIQPCSESAYTKLEESIVDDGCLSPITIWNEIIVDGHKRYDICKIWGIPFNLKQLQVYTKAEVYYQICSEQLKREDLTREMRKYLIGRAYQAEVEKNANLYVRSNEMKDSKSHPFIPPKAYNKQEISHKIGNTFHIAPGTVFKYETYTKIINSLRDKDLNLAENILSGKIRVSHENMVELNRLPAHEVKSLNQYIMENSIAHINYAVIRQSLQWKYTYTEKSETRRRKQEPSKLAAIKKMPKYDPDSSLSSLVFTSPSWRSIIDRARIDTDFSKASKNTKEKVLYQLRLLKLSIKELEDIIKEDTTNGRPTELCAECSLRTDTNKEPGF
ncbi:hypothetical protein ACGCUP_03905 [Eubacteriales bacterium KG125]